MQTNIKLYDGTTDPEDHLNRFASEANSKEWPMLLWCRMFQQTLDGYTRGWFKRLLNNSINERSELREAFIARGAEGHEDRIVYGLTQVPRIGKVPHIVEEMMVRTFLLVVRRDDRSHINNHGGEARRNDSQNNPKGRDNYGLYRGRNHQAPYPLLR
nr:hypothetical protein [Tanacetum cinerariifolium]